MKKITKAQVLSAGKILQGITGYGEGFDYKCYFVFHIVEDYLQGNPNYYQPHEWRDFVRKFKKEGISGLRQMIEIDKIGEGKMWFSHAFIDDLTNHPVCRAYLLGAEKGAGAVYEGSKVMSVEGHDQITIDRRTIHKSAIELAIADGAVFGGIEQNDFDCLMAQMYNELRCAHPMSFDEHCASLFRLAYKTQSAVPNDMEETARFKLFADTLFHKVIYHLENN
jgi:hypothetical protein